MPSRADQPQAAWTAGILLLCIGLTLLPLWQTPTPPLFDYPNHIGRIHILSEWDRFAWMGIYAEGGFIIPNVLSDILAIGFAEAVGTLLAGRLLVALTLVGTLTGAFALHAAATGRISPWPALVTPFLYNEMFFWGFLNYVFGLALLLWACAAWLHFERRSRRLQLIAGTAFAVAVFFAHLVAFGLFAVAVAVFELYRAWLRRNQERPVRMAMRLAASAACFVPAAAVLLLGSPSRELGIAMDFNFDPFLKLSPFTRLLASGNLWTDALVLCGMAALLAVLVALRLIALEPRLVLCAAAFVTLSLVLPYTAMGSYFVDTRIPVAAAMLALSAVRGHRLAGRGAVLAGAAFAGLIAARGMVIAEDWRGAGQRYAPLLEAFAAVPSGSLVVPVSATPFEFAAGWFETWTVHPPHEHVVSYATVVSGAVTTNIFARRGQNPLVLVPSSDGFSSLTGPIRRVWNATDLANFAEEIRTALAADPVFSSRTPYVVAFGIRCGDWPPHAAGKPVSCRDDYSLMALPGGPSGVYEDMSASTSIDGDVP